MKTIELGDFMSTLASAVQNVAAEKLEIAFNLHKPEEFAVIATNKGTPTRADWRINLPAPMGDFIWSLYAMLKETIDLEDDRSVFDVFLENATNRRGWVVVIVTQDRTYAECREQL